MTRLYRLPREVSRASIPIRTFAQCDDHRPGFVEVDLVSHDDGHASGDYQTLTLTDVATGPLPARS